MIHAANGVTVRWVGGLWVAWGADALLLDAGPASVALGADLAALRALVLTNGRMAAIGGLPALLEAAAAWREAELPVHHVLGEERASFLVEAWQRGWPDRYDVSIDARHPGERFDVGPFQLTSRRVGHAEPAIALTLRGPLQITYVPLAEDDTPIGPLVRGADLAVVQVATRVDRRGPPLLRAEQAIAAAEHVALLWLIDEDGAPFDPAGA